MSSPVTSPVASELAGHRGDRDYPRLRVCERQKQAVSVPGSVLGAGPRPQRLTQGPSAACREPGSVLSDLFVNSWSGGGGEDLQLGLKYRS